ncbi:hypothetical protein L3Q82_017007 [Scortum barcoo]|uniref:Uncharacterized protein n=1 Tax=Scortum barcoo TaxID=214431 RepID=A0ACB8X9Y8_9TELE|nr:hypothetical protein L3Q82_017007 [Scortum barcoo]
MALMAYTRATKEEREEVEARTESEEVERKDERKIMLTMMLVVPIRYAKGKKGVKDRFDYVSYLWLFVSTVKSPANLIPHKAWTKKSGDMEEYRKSRPSREPSAAQRDSDRDKAESHYQGSKTRSMWAGLKTLTDYKKEDQQCLGECLHLYLMS